MKIAVVIGAPSGMGGKIIIQLQEHLKGFDETWTITRRRERLDELDRQAGVPLHKFALDLTRGRDGDVLSQALVTAKPQVKLLVNATGFGKVERVEELGLRSEADMMVLNREALCTVTRTMLSYTKYNNRIIQYASSAAFLLQSGFAIYVITKSFVLSYSRALNQELRSRRIYMMAVCSRPVNTEFFDIAESTDAIPLYKGLVTADPKRVVQKIVRDSIAGGEISVYDVTMKVFQLLCKVLPHCMLLAVINLMNE